jgi:glycosyltransferase involved in cell wall biosynthesis
LDQAKPETDRLDRINPDGSYFGGTIISLLRIVKYLRETGHIVDLDEATLDAYDVLIVCVYPELVDRYSGLKVERKFIWLHDVHHAEELNRYSDCYDGAITVSPFVTSFYVDVHPSILTSTNPLEPAPTKRTEPQHLSLCFAGMFHKRRNVHFAIEVLGQIQERLPEATLTLYGSYSLWREQQHVVGYNCNEQYFPFVEQAMKKAKPGSVVFAGNVANTELLQNLGGHHFLLVPSDLDESCSMVSIEAQSVGTVVIASNRGALPDTVGSGGLSLTLAPALWAEKIEHIYKFEWERYSRAALEHFRQRFRMDSTIQSWIRYINR